MTNVGLFYVHKMPSEKGLKRWLRRENVSCASMEIEFTF